MTGNYGDSNDLDNVKKKGTGWNICPSNHRGHRHPLKVLSPNLDVAWSLL